MTINVGELVVTTLRDRRGKLTDNVTNHNALLHHMNKKGKVDPSPGGRELVEELEYAENGTAAWYEGYEAINITPSEVFDAATYDWRQLAGSVSINGLETMQNNGAAAVIDLLDRRIKNLQRTLRNRLATALYSDGTTAKQIEGLQHLVPDDPTAASTVGGIAQATYTWWRSQMVDGVTSGNIQTKMDEIWLNLIRGDDKADIIMADSVFYKYYEQGLTQYARFTRDHGNKATGGFEHLAYKSANVYYDDQCPASHMYFLNCNYLRLRPHSKRQFVPLNRREPVNQDAQVVPVVWGGNLTCSNRSLQGVLIA